MRNNLELGKWNVICDRCGFQYKNTDLQKEWTGLMVCTSCWEPRHPQTLIKVPKEDSSIPWARPEPTEIYVSVPDPISTESLIPIVLETNPDMLLFTEG